MEALRQGKRKGETIGRKPKMGCAIFDGAAH